MKKAKDKIQRYKDVTNAFYALCQVTFPEPMLDVYQTALAELSGQMAKLESEIGTDNL